MTSTELLLEGETADAPMVVPAAGGPEPAFDTVRISSKAARNVLSSTSTLGLGIVIERGAGFLANILAARFAGASTFGAYSLAISTANNISTYAAGGIGATAARFSGKYTFPGAGYSTLARTLGLVSLVSAVFASTALWAGAAPIAHLLHRNDLTPLLRWAALSAAGIIVLECARGFFVGQRRLAALLLLSLIVGAGLVLLLPLSARTGKPAHMIVVQGSLTLGAVAACLLLAKPLGLLPSQPPATSYPFRPMLREVWGFGFVQLAGMVGSNLSGWWLTALVARSDTSLVQMSYFAIASQMRNLAGLVPGMLTEGSYAVMADPSEDHLRTPHRVMALCTFASATVALLLAGLGMVVAPWVLLRLYGSAYRGAALTVSLGLATAMVHMGNAPAAARLTIVSIRASGVINTLWAVLVAGCATLLLLHGGTSAMAMAIFFAAHVTAAALVLGVLARKDYLPSGMRAQFALTTGAATLLAFFAWVRENAAVNTAHLSALMLLVLCGAGAALVLLGRKHHWLPTGDAVRTLSDSLQFARHRILRSSRKGLSHGA